MNRNTMEYLKELKGLAIQKGYSLKTEANMKKRCTDFILFELFRSSEKLRSTSMEVVENWLNARENFKIV